jgi:hypothetical protein
VNALGWLYISQGRGRDMMRWGVVGCSLIVVSFAAGLPWGPVGVACAYALVVYLVIVPLAYWLAGCKGPVTTADLWRLTGFALLFALPTVLASAIVAYCFPHLTSLEGVVLSGFASALASALALACTKSGRTLVYESVAQIQNAVRQPRKL